MRVRWGIAVLFILCGVSTACGWQNGMASLSIRQAGIDSEEHPQAKVGEQLSLELFLDAQGERISGCVAFVSFDKTLFEWVPAGASNRPFEQGSFFHGLGAISENASLDLSDTEMGLKYVEMTGVAVDGVRPSASGTGVLARFSLLVLRQSAEPAEIRIAMDYKKSPTRYFIAGSFEEYRFRFRTGLSVQTVGFAISPPFSDVDLLPGDSTEVFLDDHVDDFKTRDEDILWSVHGGEHVTAYLDTATRSVVVRADTNWKGQEPVLFEAQNSDTLIARSAMLVTVGYPPEMAAFEVRIEEDGGRWIRLSDHATDRDTELSELNWMLRDTVGDGEWVNALVQGDSLWMEARQPDWFGTDTMVLFVADEVGLADSAVVSVVVTPVNDPPVVTDSLEVALVGTRPGTIFLDRYVSDVDNEDHEIRWTVSDGDTVTGSIDEENRSVTFTAPPGWTGTETILLAAFDPDGLSDSTMVRVSGSLTPPALDLPERFFFFSDSGKLSVDLKGEDTFVLDRFVSDADDSLSALQWMVAGNSELVVELDSVSHALSIVAPENFLGAETLIFTVTDPVGQSACDTSRVIVLIDGGPTVTELPNVALSIGETSAPIWLNDYVWDRDTPDSLITWTPSGNTHVSVSIDPQSHALTFSAEDALWIGSETVTLSATDPEGRTGHSAVVITVIAGPNGPLQFTIGLLRNPILIQHVDFYVVANKPLGGGPTATVSGAPLDLVEVDSLRHIFRGGTDLDSDSLLTVRVSGTDSLGNVGIGERTFSARFVQAARGGTLESPDGASKVCFPGGALGSDQWIFMYQEAGIGGQGSGGGKTAPQAGFGIEKTASRNPQFSGRYILDAMDKTFRKPVEWSISYDAVRYGDDVGVFRWDEREAAWRCVPTCLDRAGRRAVAVVSQPGAYRLQKTVHHRAGTLPSRLKLLPNYPNPFNAETCIVYELPRSGPVSIRIYNLHGQLIRQVMEGHQEGGSHLVRWDGKDGEGRETGSGVYIYRVKFDGNSDAGKMVKVE